jgi:MOSC domain-containing protein YiiM
MPQVLQVCTGRAQRLRVDGREVLSAIAKTPVAGPVAVGVLGLAGDEQADLSVHGGLSKAVYAYPSEHLAFWQTVRAQAQVAPWGQALPAGAMGENLLLQGLLERDLWIGDRLLIGSAARGCVLVVSEPRQPCFKFGAAMGFAQAAKLMTQSGFCGSYLAVLEPGTVQAGDPIELQPGPREIGIQELFKARGRRA